MIDFFIWLYMSTWKMGFNFFGIVSTCWLCTSRGGYWDDFLGPSTMEHQGSLLCSPNHVLNLFMGNAGYHNVLQLKCTTQIPSHFVHHFNSCWQKQMVPHLKQQTELVLEKLYLAHCFDPSKIVDGLALHKCAKQCFFLQFLRRAMMGGSQRSVRKWWLIQSAKHSQLPSGKRLHSYGKSPFLMGTSTISMDIFNSKLLNYQRVPCQRTIENTLNSQGTNHPRSAQLNWTLSNANPLGGAITILKNDGVRQWEEWHPIDEMENK